jgi:hypothetical protein
VLDIKIKEDDDDNGPMGTTYTVKCKMINAVYIGTGQGSLEYREFEAICHVDRIEFQKYLRKKNAVIWL